MRLEGIGVENKHIGEAKAGDKGKPPTTLIAPVLEREKATDLRMTAALRTENIERCFGDSAYAHQCIESNAQA